METIRFYQRRGLMPTPERWSRRRRWRRAFAVTARRTCAGCASSAPRRPPGFTLEQIEELLSLDAGEDRARARVLAAERLEALDRTIADLERRESGPEAAGERLRRKGQRVLSDYRRLPGGGGLRLRPRYDGRRRWPGPCGRSAG